MDPLTAQFSFGMIFLSSSSALWFLRREHALEMKRCRGIEARLVEVEKLFSEVKSMERDLRRKQHRQANLHLLEQKLEKAQASLLSAKAAA